MSNLGRDGLRVRSIHRVPNTHIISYIYTPPNGHPEAAAHIPVVRRKETSDQAIGRNPPRSAVRTELLNLVTQVGP